MRLTGTEVRAALVAVLIARTALTGGVRVVYPFLPEIARGLGVSFAALAAVVALRSFASIAAPAVPRLAERFGRRTLMLAACVAVAVGCLLTAASTGLALAAVGFVAVGLAKPAFDVPMQGWFADRVPYERRGRVLGLTELPWSLALLVTVPVSGVLIAGFGWQAPFLLVAVLAVVGAVAVAVLIAPDRPAQRVRRPLRLDRAGVVLLGVTLLFSLASELLFVVYGAWLEDDFGLSVSAIGVFTLVVVAAELAGEGAVAGFADRVGLRRSVLCGLLVSAVAYAALGMVGSSLLAAVAVVVVWFVTFEITICAAIPLASEAAPAARDRFLAALVTTVAIGRALGAVAAAPTYALGGITASGLAAAACVLAAAALLARCTPPP